MRCDKIGKGKNLGKKKVVKTHCPNTCEVCNEHDFSDSTTNFIYSNEERSCAWVRGTKNKNLISLEKMDWISKLCDNYDIRNTCRKTCGIFRLCE